MKLIAIGDIHGRDSWKKIVSKETGEAEETIEFEKVKQWFYANMHPDNNKLDDQNVFDYVYHKGNYYEIIDDGYANTANEFTFGSDKSFYITIKGKEVNTDVFMAK